MFINILKVHDRITREDTARAVSICSWAATRLVEGNRWHSIGNQVLRVKLLLHMLVAFTELKSQVVWICLNAKKILSLYLKHFCSLDVTLVQKRVLDEWGPDLLLHWCPLIHVSFKFVIILSGKQLIHGHWSATEMKSSHSYVLALSGLLGDGHKNISVVL